MLTLSYGQRASTLVARAFAGDARVLLLDEVFNGLDARAREKLRRALERPRGGHDWVLTSHRPKELPANVTHVARIEAGRYRRRRSAGHRGITARYAVAARSRVPDASAPQRHSTRRCRPAAHGSFASSNATIYRDYRPVIRDLNWTIAARRALGGARCERFRQVDVAQPDLRRSASGARRHDRARRAAAGDAHRGVEASRRLGVAGAAGRSLSRRSRSKRSSSPAATRASD